MNWCAVVLCAGLVSCTLGPEWEPPAMPVPEVFRGGGLAGCTMADLPWQEVLHDEQLGDLLRDVFVNNRSLEVLWHNVESARLSVSMAGASFFPWLGYSASSSKGANDSGGASVVQQGGQTTHPGAVSVTAAWELDLWGKTRRGIESADASAQALQEQWHGLRVSLLRQVACGYLQLLMLDEQLEIAKAAVESYRDSLRLFQSEMQIGVANRLQIVSASAALAAAEAEIPALQRQIHELENALSVLAGRVPDSVPRSGSLSSFADASVVSPGIPADILARRPDIRAKEQELRAANADVGVAIASYFPGISLTAAGGVASMDLRHAVEGSRTGWGIGVNLTGPLFRAGQLRSSERMKRERFLAAKAEYEQTVLDALAEIASTLTKRRHLRQMILKQQKAVAAYQESVALSKSRYASGLANYYEVLTAQQGLFPAQVQLCAYRYEYAACIPTLYVQLGGGWKSE